MFKDNPKTSPDDTQTIIGASVQVEGDFDGQGNVVVEGKLKGSLKTAKNITVGEHAVVEADVHANSAHVAGSIKGNITVADKIEITKTADIQGNITAATIAIEAGAKFNGSCTTSASGATQATDGAHGQQDDSTTE